MLADALRHNTTLQTLKLGGNDIQTERTLAAIQKLLKQNRESAKKKFAEEHPELATRKLSKPERSKSERTARRGQGEGRPRRARSSVEEGGRASQRKKEPLTGRRAGSEGQVAATTTGPKKDAARPPSKLPIPKFKKGTSGGGETATTGTFV